MSAWRRQIIYTQKFEGSAAGLLNPNIIARDLGLNDKQELIVNYPQKIFSREHPKGLEEAKVISIDEKH